MALMLPYSKNFAALKTQGAESSAVLGRLEQASATQSQTASMIQQDVHARLQSYEDILKKMAAVSNDQANAMQDMLSQIKQQVQNASASRSSNASGILGEINEDQCKSVEDDGSIASSQDVENGLDAQLLESIERLGRLVHEKEHTFDDDDVECDTIIESLRDVLDTATKQVADMSQDTAARAIAKFTKRHGSHGVTLNSQGTRNASNI